jgi:hypothetical protein
VADSPTFFSDVFGPSVPDHANKAQDIGALVGGGSFAFKPDESTSYSCQPFYLALFRTFCVLPHEPESAEVASDLDIVFILQTPRK